MKTKSTNPLQEIVFNNGEHHFNALLADINRAQQSIDLETYIFNHDALGQKIVNALIAASKRGVEVRILVDGCGTPKWSAHWARPLEEAGAFTKVFHPFPWQLWNWSRSVVRLPALLKWIYLFLKLNYRNHRKVCIIDRHIAYVGSFNISQCHLDKTQGGESWRDTSVRLTQINLAELQQAFDSAWEHKPVKERLREIFKTVRRDPIIRVNNTRHRRRILYKHLLRRIRQCQKRIWITNAYFVPDNFLLRKLKDAAKRGVDVRILLTSQSDVLMMPWASSTFYYSLLRAGVRIFEYLPSVLHAKTLIVDDWVVIGSSNLNHRSLLHDLEADINITDRIAKDNIINSFLDDLKSVHEIELEKWHKQRPIRQRFFGRLVLYIKYWI
ncbi:MAG: cardiolipin synthase B [Gammaproteobacteria bacterium]|nr:cardiolipin synthase B [Gammaproteobacteria bacterium]